MFRSAEEKDEARSQAAARKAAARARAALQQHEKSPLGRAESALARGQSLFQASLLVDDDSAATLSQIESLGWHLEHAGYVNELSLWSSSNMQNQLETVSSSGQLIGVYLFRRD